MTMFRYKPKKRSTFYPVIVCSLLICTSLSAQSTEPQNEQDAARAQAAAELWRDAIEPGVFPPEPESRLIKKAEQKEEGKGNVASVDAYSASSGSFTGLNIGNMVLDRLKVSEQVTPETTDLFGETIDLNTGAVSFQQTDVSLPGNSSLPVEVRRIFRGASYAHHTSLNFGDWQLAIPSYGTARLYNNRLFFWFMGNRQSLHRTVKSGVVWPWPQYCDSARRLLEWRHLGYSRRS